MVYLPTKLGDFGQGQMLGFIFQHHGSHMGYVIHAYCILSFILYRYICIYIYVYIICIYIWWVITIHVRVIPFENQPRKTVVFTVFTMVVIQKGS